MAEASLPKRTRSFGPTPVAEGEETAVAPLGFTLAGEDFEVIPEAPGIVILEFIEATSSGQSGATSKALIGFLKEVTTEEEWERLNAVLHDPKNRIDIKTISDIVSYLTEQYASRPTSAS
jgi:hypothetical protein